MLELIKKSVQLSSLNPIIILFPSKTIGRFTNIPSLARMFICSFSLISASFFERPSSLYFFPLLLKNFLRGSPLSLCHVAISSAVGLSVFMLRKSCSIPLLLSQSLAFSHVVQFIKHINNIL